MPSIQRDCRDDWLDLSSIAERGTSFGITVASSLEYLRTGDDLFPLLAFSINNISVYSKRFSQTRHNREQRCDYLSPVLHPALPRSSRLTVPIPVNASRKQVE